MPFVAAILRRLRSELNGEVPLVGFSGAPWTLASYMIEGGGSKSFAEIKKMAFSEPAMLHALLDKLATTIIAYLRFQIEAGAQVVQVFDTWAGELTRQRLRNLRAARDTADLLRNREQRSAHPLYQRMLGNPGIDGIIGRRRVEC